MRKTMVLGLLYFDECPCWRQALENLRQALILHGTDIEVSLIEVKDQTNADELPFQGSPTLRVSGNDLFPEDTNEYGFSCRLYKTEKGLRDLPTTPIILECLRDLASSDTALGPAN